MRSAFCGSGQCPSLDPMHVNSGAVGPGHATTSSPASSSHLPTRSRVSGSRSTIKTTGRSRLTLPPPLGEVSRSGRFRPRPDDPPHDGTLGRTQAVSEGGISHRGPSVFDATSLCVDERFRMVPRATDDNARMLGQEWAKQHAEMTGNHRYLPGLFPQVRFDSGPLARIIQPPSQGGDTGSNPVGTTQVRGRIASESHPRNPSMARQWSVSRAPDA